MPNASARLIEAAGEVKLCALDLEGVARDGVFEGYASLFNRQDMGRDVVMPGAFRASLAERGTGGIRMLFQHDPAQPIGTWLAIYEDARGLKVRGKLATEVARAREVLALMRAGAIDGLSIGFKAIDARRERATGIRRLTRIDLWEISIVTFPMLPGARVSAIKSRRPDPAGAELPLPCATLSEAEQRALAKGNCRHWQRHLESRVAAATRLIRGLASPRASPSLFPAIDAGLR